MAAASPETLNPPVNRPDSPSSQPEPTPEVANPTEKRKREDEVQPDKNPETESPQRHPLWKTSLCSYFRRTNGDCNHGETCRFAHGESELRPRADNTWDPTSERAKKMARKEESGEESKETEDVKAEEKADVMMTEACADGDDWLARCIVHLPIKWSSDNLRCFLKEKGISFKSAKKKKGMNVGFVNFADSEQLKTAVEELDGKAVGNKTLKVADVIPRSFEKTNRMALPSFQNNGQSAKPEALNDNPDVPESSNNCDGDGPSNDSLVPGNPVLKGRSVRKVVTPLAHLSYPDQLEQKKNTLIQILKKLTRNARKACPDGVALPEWIHKSRDIGGLPCKLEGIIESPIVNGYRNKCEFSVGYSLQGKPTVGFLLGNFREGVTAVEEPTDCPNVSRIACRYAATFQEFLQSSSLPIWNRLNNTGFWRQLTVREGRMPGKTGEAESSVSEVMLMVQVCMAGFDEEQVNGELGRMAQAFIDGHVAEPSPLPLTALMVQDHRGISNVAPADAPLHRLSIPFQEGDFKIEAANKSEDSTIHDCISNLQFRISPTAFFQVNTLAAEKLYALAGDWADLGPDTLLFDVCCGTGTIGLTLAHRVGMVVGIEMNASAVSDAHRNAEINGIKNCRFICAKAEDVMGSLLKEYLITSQKADVSSEISEKNNEEIRTSEEKVNGTETERGLVPEHGSGESNPRSMEDGSEVECPPQNDYASETMPGSMLHFKNVVAIVDPPRVGLHPTVIKVLRTHAALKRLVYISCNSETLVANAIELCTPSADKSEKGSNKNNRGWRNMSSAGLARHRVKSMPNSEPFKPVKAMAVDLFPHTPHCELVMLLER